MEEEGEVMITPWCIWLSGKYVEKYKDAILPSQFLIRIRLNRIKYKISRNLLYSIYYLVNHNYKAEDFYILPSTLFAMNIILL